MILAGTACLILEKSFLLLFLQKKKSSSFRYFIEA